MIHNGADYIQIRKFLHGLFALIYYSNEKDCPLSDPVDRIVCVDIDFNSGNRLSERICRIVRFEHRQAVGCAAKK